MFNNKIVSLVYKSILLTISLLAIYEYILYFNWNLFAYFTILSNILVFVVFLIVWIKTLKDVAIKKEYEGYNEHILIGKFTATIAITVTFLVYAFMLADYSSKDNYDIQNLSEHYIIPLMVIIDYFMFDKKGTIKWYHPLIWVGCIITYLPYIFIRANIVGNNTYTKYPYFFLDIDESGASEVTLWCLGLLVFFTGLSYLVMLFDSKYNKNKNNLEK